jgi:hypothetical protein
MREQKESPPKGPKEIILKVSKIREKNEQKHEKFIILACLYFNSLMNI